MDVSLTGVLTKLETIADTRLKKVRRRLPCGFVAERSARWPAGRGHRGGPLLLAARNRLWHAGGDHR